MPPKMNPNLPTRQAVYNFILAYKQDHNGISPTVREIQNGTGIRSTSHVHLLLASLDALGLIQLGSGPRSITVVGGSWQPPTAA
jgi:SOS-response transcriptional repressor LexA